MGLFTAKPDKEFPIRRVMHDAGKVFNLDNDYVMRGEREGWLKFNGYYQSNGVMYFTYSLR